MYKLEMNVSQPYNIYIEEGLLDKLEHYLKSIYQQKNIYIITDERVGSLYLKKLINSLKEYQVFSVVIRGYEESKSIETYSDICEKLISLGITRGDLLIALGGGVIGDITGFVAGTLYRGIKYIQIPTSLLAQVDSSIGGKTGIDFMGHKNILGVFNQPQMVLIDPSVLKTLPLEHLKNGYGEMIKHALIGSPKLFDLLASSKTITEEIIYENLLVKKHHVMMDEFDKGERMKLNFGHTFGHIIELENNLLHGEAVLSGILCSLDFAERLGFDIVNIKEKTLQLYQKYDLKYLYVDYRTLKEKLRFDKKNFSGTINFILVNEIGKSFIYPVKESDFDGYFN